MQVWHQLAGVRKFRIGRKTSLILNAWADYTMLRLQKRLLDSHLLSLVASQTLTRCFQAWKQTASVSLCSILRFCEMLLLTNRLADAGLLIGYSMHKTLNRLFCSILR